MSYSTLAASRARGPQMHLEPSAGITTFQLCDFGQVARPLRGSVSASMRWAG